MSEWNSKNKPGVKTRDPEYPDLTTDFADPSNDNNQYRGKDNLVGWYRFLGVGAVGRVDGGTTNTFPNMALTGSDGQTLTTSGSLGSAVYYEESIYGAAVTYKAHYQSPFDQPGAAVPADQWSNSFNQQITPYLPTNMANGALPFSGSKAEQNYFRITDTDNWNIYASGAEFSVAVWVRMNNYQNGQQQSDNVLPLITKIKQGTDWADGGEFSITWYPASITSMNIRGYVMSDDNDYQYARSGYFNENSAANEMDSTTYPEPLAEVPPNGSWVHVVMTWNGTNTDSGTAKPSSNSTDAVKTYINGHFMLYDNTLTGFSGDIRSATNSTCGDILINAGRDDDAPTDLSKYTNQDIAEVAFWSKCLSPKEVKALYHGTTQGIKKYDSGLVKNPARPQLQRLDDTSGNAYPTIGGSANQYRLGKRKVHFDDTLTRVFTQSNGSVNMGARLRSDDKLLSASFSTPNKLPTLTVGVTGNSENAGRIDARIMGNLPFLTASVTEFKDRYNPFDDTSAPPRSDGHFYLTGSMLPTLNVRLADKSKVTIPLNNTRGTTFGANQSTKPYLGTSPPGSGGGSNGYGEYQLMVYWNAKESRWEKTGRGLSYVRSAGNSYFKIVGGAESPNMDAGAGTGTQAEGYQQRNVNFALCGFSPSQAYVFTRDAVDEGGAITYSGKVAVNGVARPISTYGFPFDARYHATSSQQIQMSDYIDAPFLLEKCEWHYSGAIHTTGDGDGGCNLMVANNQYFHGGGGSAKIPTTVNNTTFFILRQRAGVFTYSEESTVYDSFSADGSKRVLYKTRLTSSIPGIRCTNLDGLNNQHSFETVHDTRELVTYDQHTVCWKDSRLIDTATYSGYTAMPNFDIDGDDSPATLEEILADGLGRGLTTVIDAKMGRTVAQGGPSVTYVGNPESGGYVYGGAVSSDSPQYAGSVRGSFVVTGSCKTSAINREGVVMTYDYANAPNFAGLTGRGASFEQKNLLGGRMNPESRLGDRRPLFNGLASGLTGSVPNIMGGVIGGGILAPITASEPSTYGKESPYILMPEDTIIIGAQAESMQWKYGGWYQATAQDRIAQGAMNTVIFPEAPGKLVMYGTYLKDHKTSYSTYNQQITTNAVHTIVSNGPVLDQWEISAVSEYSGSYLGRSITGSMTTPAIGWPRAPSFRASSLWASASATPRPGAAVGAYGITGSAYSDTGGPFDGGIKPWVSSSAYHSSSLHGRYFSSYLQPGQASTTNTTPTPSIYNQIIGGGLAPDPMDDPLNKLIHVSTTDPSGTPILNYGRVVAREPSSTREVAATVYQGMASSNSIYARRPTGDVFGFHRNIRLACAEETYYDSLVPDPIQCWLADGQTKSFGGDNLIEATEAGNTGSLGIGKSARGSQSGGDGVGTYNGYTNEYWISSFPFEAKYRGFQEPPIDALKRRSTHTEQMNVAFAATAYSMQGAYSASAPYHQGAPEPSWNGFDPTGTSNSENAYAYLSGFVTINIDGKKPGLQKAYNIPGEAKSNSGVVYPAMNYITGRNSSEDTVLPALFGFGTGPEGAMNPWKRSAGGKPAGQQDGRFFFVAQKQRGCKYGLYSWKPRATSTIFRSNAYGQLRDMLEQRRYSRFFLKSDNAVETDAPVICQFKEPIWLDPISNTDKAPFDTQCSNLSTFATSSVPYFDGEVKNRGPLVADGSDTIVIE
jgi:hypothetical protein